VRQNDLLQYFKESFIEEESIEDSAPDDSPNETKPCSKPEYGTNFELVLQIPNLNFRDASLPVAWTGVFLL